jgi:hypothetical protein
MGVVGQVAGVRQVQARELEKLIARVEQVTSHLPEANELSVVQSGLTALNVRIKEFRARQPTRS